MDKCYNFEKEGAKEKIPPASTLCMKGRWLYEKSTSCSCPGDLKQMEQEQSLQIPTTASLLKTASVMMIELLKQLAKLLTLAKG